MWEGIYGKGTRLSMHVGIDGTQLCLSGVHTTIARNGIESAASACIVEFHLRHIFGHRVGGLQAELCHSTAHLCFATLAVASYGYLIDEVEGVGHFVIGKRNLVRIASPNAPPSLQR